MKRLGLLVICALYIGGVVSVSQAGVIPLSGQSLTDLLGVSHQPVGTLLETDMNNGNLLAEAHSRAYTDGAGLYAYLYQVHNVGEPGNAAIEMLTLCPFTGADDFTSLGWLTGDDFPGEFSSGGQDAETDAFVDVLSTGPEISFYFAKKAGKSIDVGEHSVVLYVMSDLEPDQIIGNVINGSVASGPVVGPVPEPATIGMLLCGAVMIVKRRRRRRA
ncbi:MAG: PEP-CTERM sorting domain-containing protein [Phycisphaerae bacterium]|nr:PEP-CTERM sorting domain-containing protein [Phycisphaerae bacterium]